MTLAASVGLMDLRAACEEGRQHCRAHAAAEIAGEVGEAGDLVVLVARHADVIERADRDEDEGQTETWSRRHSVIGPKLSSRSRRVRLKILIAVIA